MRAHPRALWVLPAALVLAGCDHDVYEVHLVPLDAGFRRTLECRRIDRDEHGREVLKPMPQETLDRLAGLYGGGPAPLSAARRFPFVGEFAEAVPDDVGGAGYCRTWPSSLGTLGLYAERFRGTDDQAATLEMRLQAADRLAELLADWLRPRLGQTPGSDRLLAFAADGLRKDLRNLAAMAWAGNFARDAGFAKPPAAAGQATAARAALFLAERGYLLPADIPAWSSALAEQGKVSGSLAPLAPLLAHAVARRAGLPPDSEAILALRQELGRDTLLQGLMEFLRTTPEWQALKADWEQRRQQDPAAGEPSPGDVLGNLAATAAGFGPGSAGEDELVVRLAVPLEPFETNGAWDPEKGTVRWETALPGPAGAPFLAYAAWAEPAAAVQTERFGRVALRGRALAAYVLWLHGLAPEERAEWEAFLDRLRPQGDPAARVAEFRFEHEREAGPPADENLAASRAQPARELLLEALRE